MVWRVNRILPSVRSCETDEVEERSVSLLLPDRAPFYKSGNKEANLKLLYVKHCTRTYLQTCDKRICSFKQSDL